METPSRQLAAKILNRLIQEKLISADSRGKLHDRLASGKMKPEDWRFAVEMFQTVKDKE